MPSTIQGLVILFLAVLPGFVTVAVVRRTRPARENSPFDAVVWCIVYSAIADTILIVLFAYIAKWYFKDDFAKPFRMDLGRWLAKYLPNHLHEFGLWIGTYLLVSILLAVIIGLVVATLTKSHVPVWYFETVSKSLSWSWWRLKRTAGISMLVDLHNGDRYIGTLKSAPTDYEALIDEKKDFSMVNVVYISSKKADPEILSPNETVLLNTRDVVAIRIVEEALTE